MRITQNNVSNLKDYVEQIQESGDDFISAAEEWLEGLEDPERDADEQREARESIEEFGEQIIDLAKCIVQIPDKYALYEAGRDKKLKARVTELEDEVERLRNALHKALQEAK